MLAATEHLHRRISALSGRIRQLEDALSSIHGKYSSEPHPLLHEDLIHVAEREGEYEGAADEGQGQAQQPVEVLDAFGTLSISEHGISRFFGPTGGSEVRRFYMFSLAACRLLIVPNGNGIRRVCSWYVVPVNPFSSLHPFLNFLSHLTIISHHIGQHRLQSCLT